MEETTFDLVDIETGIARGRVRIALLPSVKTVMGLPALTRGDDDGLERIQLLEGCEYIYEVEGGSRVEIDKAEMFAADDVTGRRGRLRTRLSTGRVEVNIFLDGRRANPFAFEVRSTKLGYLDDYRWMLEDIAELGASLLLERFAPSEQRLSVDDTADAETLYQRFVFLRGLLQGERLSAALRRVVEEPYVQWEMIEERVSPGRGLRGSGALARQLAKPGPRAAWLNATHPALLTVPHSFDVGRSDETTDNVPNRFVLFALEEWRGLVASMLDVLENERKRSFPSVPEPIKRGVREGQDLALHLDSLIQAPVFQEVGRLTSFPLANQVLQKKQGYREVFHAYLLVQLGASLSWTGGEDVFSGGQRNVATLYEYWVFLELAKIISGLCDSPLDLQALVAESASGMNLALRRERASSIRGGFTRRGRRFSVELCFNQQFAPGPNGTWTKSLRPDCSLHVVPLEAARREDHVWLHFDAKYRIDTIEGVMGDDDSEPARIAKTEDLYKMHTYRDAIVRAVGAFVIFPGTAALTREQYGEVLPGLGAFPLRPSRGGIAEGADALRTFLQQAFDHIATQTTRHERARYWRRIAVGGAETRGTRDAVDFIDAPPSDTQVLLGYAKSSEHREWVCEHRLYNLRADPGRRGAVGLQGPELSARLLVLYGSGDALLFRVVNEPYVLLSEELAQLGYPEPHGRAYFCFQLEAIRQMPSWWPLADIEAVVRAHQRERAHGTPIVISWHDVVESVLESPLS